MYIFHPFWPAVESVRFWKRPLCKLARDVGLFFQMEPGPDLQSEEITHNLINSQNVMNRDAITGEAKLGKLWTLSVAPLAPLAQQGGHFPKACNGDRGQQYFGYVFLTGISTRDATASQNF